MTETSSINARETPCRTWKWKAFKFLAAYLAFGIALGTFGLLPTLLTYAAASKTAKFIYSKQQYPYDLTTARTGR